MLTTVQPRCCGPFEGLLGAGGVVELALGVVVEDEQAKRRLVGVLGEVEHLDVAVGVARGEKRPTTGAAPDPDRFLRAVVEVVGLALRVIVPPARRRCTRGRALPITRSRGMPYMSWLIGRMKSRPPPEAM